MFPKFLMRRMYAKESLKLTDDGFQFTMKNTLANANVVEVFGLSLEDIEIPFSDVNVSNDTQSMNSQEISPENPLHLNKGVNTIFKCKLDNAKKFANDSEVKIEMKFKVQVRDSNMTIDLDFKDQLRS